MEWDEFLSFLFWMHFVLNAYGEREREREAGGEGFCRARVVDAIIVEFILFLVVFDLVLQTAVATEDAPPRNRTSR
jgi:hypothetical protein